MHHRRRPALLGSAALVLTTATVLAPPPAQAASASCVPPPVAHRGASNRAPENTLPAFQRALSTGVRLLESDVRFTSDGVPVLLHDSTLDRTTNGTGAVADTDLAALRQLDAGSWFAARFAGTRVPTLAQLLVLGRRYGARFVLELKTLPTDAQMTTFLNTLDSYGARTRTTISSFRADSLDALHAAAPDLPSGIIHRTGNWSVESLRSHGRVFFAGHDSVTASRARVWRAGGLSIQAWTVDDATEWRRMAYDKVSAVVTDKPSAYLSWARRRCS